MKTSRQIVWLSLLLIGPSLLAGAEPIRLSTNDFMLDTAIQNLDPKHIEALRHIKIEYSGDPEIAALDLREKKQRKLFPLQVPIAMFFSDIKNRSHGGGSATKHIMLSISKVELLCSTSSPGWLILEPSVKIRLILASEQVVESPIFRGLDFRAGLSKMPTSLAARRAFTEAIYRSLLISSLQAAGEIGADEAQRIALTPPRIKER